LGLKLVGVAKQQPGDILGSGECGGKPSCLSAVVASSDSLIG
jgi:hypothetical protein